MRKLILLFALLPLFTFGQYRADRTRHNPVVTDCAGYGFRGHWEPAAETYCAEALALFARMTTAPTTERKDEINTLIVGLKDAGIWSKMDAMYVLAAADQQAALLNWIADTNNATAVSSPIFTADEGFNGNGTAYLNTHFDATSDATHFTQTNSCYTVYSRTDVADGNYVDIGITRYSGSYSHSFLMCRTGSNTATRALFSGTIGGGAITSSLGLFAVNVLSGNTELYQNGTIKATAAHSATFVHDGEIYICCRNYYVSSPGPSEYSKRQLSFASFGAGLSSTEQTTLTTLVEAYMDALGTGVIP